VTGNELLRKLRRLARRRGVQFEFDAAGGKGGHGLITFGHRRTTLRSSRHKEIPTGALRGMLSDLGLASKDLV
jgi:mRNA interferase HicA